MKDRDPRILVGVLPPLSRKYVLLVVIRLACIQAAILEDHGRVPKDEVDCAIDVALAIELAEGVDIKRVLVANEAATVKGGEVGAAPKGHGLVLARTGIVLEGYALRYESTPNRS